MVFSSNIFIFFFLPAVLIAYYLSPKRLRNLVLLVFSLFFYAWGEPVYLLLMLLTIVVNYLCGNMIYAQRQRGQSGMAVMLVSLIVNLGLLAYFKYAGFIAETLNAFLPQQIHIPIASIALPIGISFYTFQAMSYTIDVYRGQVPAQKSLVNFGTYVALFPQLIAGPIVRYKDVARQLDGRSENLERFSSGVVLFIIGLGKKVILANKMGALWMVLSVEGGALSAWVGMLAYTMQIYFDFSGYSDMAIGLGRMFGFEFLKNFDYPYISSSITEFWRRWHISLSTWFREYVYIPLGGNRRGIARQLLNIFIVWSLTGLWHGASWNFVLWGLYYALLLSCEKLFLLRLTENLPKLLKVIVVVLTAGFGWMLFYFTDTAELVEFLGRMFSLSRENAHSLNMILAYLPMLALAVLGATPLVKKSFNSIKPCPVKNLILILWLAVVLLLCVASLASESYNPFIYFRF